MYTHVFFLVVWFFIVCLDSTYEQYHTCMSISVWLISVNIIHSKFIHVVTKGRIFLFSGWIVFHCMCVFVCVSSLLNPIIYWWALKLFLYVVYCECCSSGHRRAGITLRYWFGFLWDTDLVFFRYTPRSRTVGSYGGLILKFLRILHAVFLHSCTNLIPLTAQ